MVLGILGGGQLGRMLALAAHPLGVRCRFLDPAPDACAASVGEHLVAPFDDEGALARLAEGAAAVTWEFESVPVVALHRLGGRVPVLPGATSLAVSQDRFEEKQAFERAGFAVAPYHAVSSPGEAIAAVERVGTPGILKTRTGGYDGRGQARVDSAGDAERAWQALGGVPAIYERRIAFRRELALLGTRAGDGAIAFYAPVETVHREGILHTAHAPAPGIDRATLLRAERHAASLLETLGHVGTFAIELFDDGETLLASELAARVHNSGHWTIEGAETSQFENHVRAVLGLPLGDTATRGHAVTVNLVGAAPASEDVLAIPGAHLHLYGKQPRPRRKLGHVTLRADTADELDARLARVLRTLRH
ncbi:MAG TPA: 5-(carboxyamino)imidazole ribonucleotide synthase [Phycisphaerales bacterium]|nr:5-(carboxyamino)imidazole ribonucleotide synthase [Phycisphaerales bacterium]